ncbi:MAG TPA: undecaprenyl-diphosphate phosphatase, partial [Vicinamibacterales bacterium]|nr:undecaprenyl-diphosphate phosphatase [Vicinamibacterales bacterium]
IQLVITAAILIAAELALRYNRLRRERAGRGLRAMDDLNPADAGVVGVAQAISILPGISRSGATIAAGVALAVGRDDAARFAFLLAIPALFGASLLELPDLANGDLGFGVALGGFVTSLITSYAAIAGLIRYLQTRTLYPFALYCVIAGVFFYFVV